jgi:hypothetical protein
MAQVTGIGALGGGTTSWELLLGRDARLIKGNRDGYLS